jgi:VWFA-related protein
MRLSLWRASVLGVLAGLLSVPASELQILARPQQQPPPPLKVPAPKPPGEKDQKDQSKQPEGGFGISIEVPLVNLEVVATDQDGNPLTGLQKGNFRVFEDGVPQQVTNFAPTEAAITNVLLVEFSKVLGPFVSYNARNWGYQFVSQLKKDDWVALEWFDLHTRIEVDFTQDKKEVQDHLEHMIFPGFSESNLFDAIMETLDRLQDVKGRKSILVLASGIDTFSKHNLDECLKRVKQTDVTIFAVGIAHAFSNYLDNHGAFDRGGFSGAGRLTFLQGENQLRNFADLTGGMAFFPQFEGEIPGRMREIAALLRAQYSVGYSPTNPARDGKYRKIKVTLVGQDGNALVVHNEKGKPVKIVVYTRQGYTAPKGAVSD